MKRIDEITLDTIAEVICGDSHDEETSALSSLKYRSMTEIDAFFQRAEIRPTGQSSTRKWFVLESLQSVNGTRNLDKILLRLSSPKEYRGDSRMTHNVMNRLNRALMLEGLEIVIHGGVEPQLRGRPPAMETPTPTVIRRDRQNTRPSKSEQNGGHNPRQSTSAGHESSQPNSASTTIFIGHGHSPLWLELKYFLEERLGLSVDEYSRVSNAGRPTTHRLSEMLDSATAAFLLMTGEDETAEGKLRARENVVHEVGLFQGKLGFERAIILLEEGCEEFSNIIGLEQIRFDKDKIDAAFEQIRMVLERESIISLSGSK